MTVAHHLPSLPAQAPAELVVARQPIFDRAGAVVAYELLYRSVDLSPAALTGDQMTAHVLLGACSIGVDSLVGDKTIFCNADRGVLTGQVEVTLPPERTVVEVLETVRPDPAVLAGCRRLVEHGYRLALDDFRWFDGAAALLELADIVKLDVLATPRRELIELIRVCRSYGVRLLAEKVETDQELAFCRSAGFELFQGYGLQRPQHVHGSEIVSSQLGRTELASAVLTEQADLEEIEQIVTHEPGLALHLIRLASVGAAYGVRRSIRSVHEALVLLGTSRLRRWVALLLLRDSGNIAPDAMATTLIRAKMCELLAVRRGICAPEPAYVAGLMSCVGLLTGLPESQLERLAIDPELARAAFARDTPLGLLIGEVVEYQQALSRADGLVGFGPDLELAAAEAVTWALPYVSSLEAVPVA
ncbi:MAG TPA: EAL domain-containing protein [Jatrophihabitans sp.]|nr:EAL domain-containing protein [Jatrophihabitans sp.]